MYVMQCMYVCMYVCVCMYVMYVCMYSMYVCTHVFFWRPLAQRHGFQKRVRSGAARWVAGHGEAWIVARVADRGGGRSAASNGPLEGRVGRAGQGATNASPMADRPRWIDRASPHRTLDWRE